MTSTKRQIELGKMDKKLKQLRTQRSELVDLIHPYQKELEQLFDEANKLKQEIIDLLKEA